MGLKDELIVKDVGKLEGFNGSNLQPYGKIMLAIALHNKVVSIEYDSWTIIHHTMGY